MGFVEKHRLHAPDGTVERRDTWQWADIDSPRKRLVFAEAGRLCSVRLDKPLGESKVLFDAADMAFERLLAPY